MSEIKIITQLKSAISGRAGQFFFWSTVDPPFALASDIQMDDEVVIYGKGEQVFWQQKESFRKEFPEITL